ncbi:MAG TPA: hypothetical protein VKT25_12725, partial [Ktedonobacteraceae bacterium]|nr:hypothetical protein [Ktedonobacteraceae bacterium]
LGKPRTIFIGSISLAITISLLPLLAFVTGLLEKHGVDFRPIQFVIAPIIMFAAGVEIDFINVPAQTAIQEQTPEWIKGRVLALQLVLYNACSIPVILGIGGFADTLGIATVAYMVAVSIVAFGLWGQYYLRKPHRWHIDEQSAKDAKEPEARQTEDSNVPSIKN